MKKRLISAFLMAVITIPFLIIGKYPFALLCGMGSVLALKELLDLKESHGKIPEVLTIASFILVICLTFSEFESPVLAIGFSYKWLGIAFLGCFLPCLFYQDKYQTKDAFYLFTATVFMGIFFNTLILLRNFSLSYFIYLLLVTILTDTFAYIIGSLIGKHKCSKISPNKTWEGCIGGIVVATIIAIIYYVNIIKIWSWPKALLLTISLSIVSELGDLFFSKIKRENKIKDFSNLIPGHGGILDRIDSLIFVVITFVVLMNIF